MVAARPFACGLLSLAVTAGADAGSPRLTRGPYLQALVADSVEVLWYTDVEGIGRVCCFTPDGPRCFEEEQDGIRHLVHLEDLSPSTDYRYEVTVGKHVLASGDGFRFRTPPPTSSGSFRAMVIGDSGTRLVNGTNHQASVTGLLEKLAADVFLHTGDINYETDEAIDAVLFSEYREIMARTSLYAARGNHFGPDPAEWLELFSLPAVSSPFPACELPAALCDEEPPLPAEAPPDRTFYSFDWGPAHVAVVDSNTGFSPCAPQLKWLCNDLSDARERSIPWLILMLHEPPFSMGSHAPRPHPNPEFPPFRLRATELIPPIADRFGVDLVLSGHDHNYQRTYPLRSAPNLSTQGRVVSGWQEPAYESPGGTVYVVSGGGGAVVYPSLPTAFHRPLFRAFHAAHHAVELEVSTRELRVRALTPDLEELDDFVIRKTGAPVLPGFRRGDIDFDGLASIADAITLLRVLFLGEPSSCAAAFPLVADTNASDRVDLTDAVYLLQFLFLGGPAPDAPFESCEPIPNLDATLCLDVGCRT